MLDAIYFAARCTAFLASLLLAGWLQHWLRTEMAPLLAQWVRGEIPRSDIMLYLDSQFQGETVSWFWLSVFLLVIIAPAAFALPLLADVSLHMFTTPALWQVIPASIAVHCLIWLQCIKIVRVAPRDRNPLLPLCATYLIALAAGALR